MLGKNASALKVLTALSPALYGAAGSSNASDLSGFGFATLIVSIGSGGSAGTTRLLFDVERSGTSGGTYAKFGASLPAVSAGSSVHIRSFTLDSSATWYRVSYDNNNNGSFCATALLQLQGSRSVPVNQENYVSSYSDVLGG